MIRRNAEQLFLFRKLQNWVRFLIEFNDTLNLKKIDAILRESKNSQGLGRKYKVKLTSCVLVGVQDNLMEWVVRVAEVIRTFPAQPGSHFDPSSSEFILQSVTNSAKLSVIGRQVQNAHLCNHKHQKTLETLHGEINGHRKKRTFFGTIYCGQGRKLNLADWKIFGADWIAGCFYRIRNYPVRLKRMTQKLWGCALIRKRSRQVPYGKTRSTKVIPAKWKRN